MKKLILTLALTIATLVASANEIRYFTRPQAMRVTAALDAQNELMIYCGYEYELATYVIINEVWMEAINSKFYEIWLYGYDAYTGEEIYMPIDLSCIWLFNSYNNRIYSAAQMLRFRSTVSMPNFYWTMPPYNAFTRHYHDPMFNRTYTYHYDVHRYGWRPPEYPHGGPAPLPPYYMRTPSTPAYVPTKPYTPGVDYPKTADGHGYLGGGRNTTGTRNTGVNNNNGGSRSGENHNNTGNTGTTNRNNTVNTNTNTGRGTATTPTTNTNTGRGTATTPTTNTNTGRGTTQSKTSTTRTNTTTPTTNSRSTNTNNSTTTRGTGTTNSNRGTTTSNNERNGNTNRGSQSTR